MISDVPSFLAAVQSSPLYLIAIVFFAVYPIVTSVMWISTSQFFKWRQERATDGVEAEEEFQPPVSVLISAHNEEQVIGSALRAVCAMDYPDFEVVVVDDGSTDRTAAVVQSFLAGGRVRLIRKAVNEGKAMALNDALPCLRGDIVLVLDADAEPGPSALRYMVRHFRSARVAAVTGNPRVKNVETLLARLQLMEFTSIVSLLRRSQRVWGRILTVSGVVSAFRKSAMIDVGGFSPDMATEDIELTWKLQKRFYDVRYEPRAVIWMEVPGSYRGLFRQRLRWARGLMQVLRRHGDVMLHWRYRRMWPVFIESGLSILWAHCFVILVTLWTISYAWGYPPIGAHPVPNIWGMLIATFALTQLFAGTWMDRRYDPDVMRYYPYAVFYPMIYWVMMALTTVIATPQLFRRPLRAATVWNTRRRDAESAPSEP